MTNPNNRCIETESIKAFVAFIKETNPNNRCIETRDKNR